MKLLKDILYGVSLVEIHGNRELNISKLGFDSRKVEEGTLFIAIKGLQSDGHDFIGQAIKSGATAVLCEQLPKDIDSSVVFIQVENSAAAMGIVAANFFNHPSKKLSLVGITGTNGKTTTATLLFQLFQKLGYQVGLLSTVENRINDQVLDTKYTTPDSLQLNELLAEMVAQGCTHCFMEASSHALVQERTSGLVFKGGVFTNISHDHLDYHETFDAYIKAKKILFDRLPKEAFALVNVDDKRGQVMLQNCKADKNTYSLKSMADYRAKVLHNTLEGLELDIDGINAWFRMIGDFNAYNLLAVYATAVLLDEDKNEVLTALSQIDGARGRFEQVMNPANVLAIVDYAHTPDALDNVLRTIDNLRTRQEKLITVVGCGGNRDKTKRPEMARIAADFSDKVILTSDNPRDEDPAVILKEMMAGVPKVAQRKTMIIQDRKEAIRTACNLAEGKDIILVAGKGHETYQEIKGVRNHFDDKEVLSEMLNN
ncbi:MAG: UDP-N-acetylmuramoyl-L-alanyl-D-glutamate--2,6-diaminopimelate ligase [Cyclobacteriaceae bacterium]